jgi:hypothetical protein
MTLSQSCTKKQASERTHWFANRSLPGERDVILVGSSLVPEHVFQFVDFLRQVDLGQGGGHDLSQIDDLQRLVGLGQCGKWCWGWQGVSGGGLLKQELNRQLVRNSIRRRLGVDS